MLFTDRPDLVGPWISARTGGSWTVGQGRTIALARGDELVAAAGFYGWNGASVCIDLAIDGKLGEDAEELLASWFHYPFEVVGVHAVNALIASWNEKSIRFGEGLGLELRGTLPGSARGGDLLVYSITKDSAHVAKWLEAAKKFPWSKKVEG